MIFDKQAKEIFKFLTIDYDFKITQDDSNFLKYENQCMFLQLSYDCFSFEIDISFGLLEAKEKTCYSLSTVISALDPKNSSITFFQCSDHEVCKRCLEKASVLIQNHCKGLLANNEYDWSKVAVAQQIEMEEIHNTYTITPIKTKAYLAWQEKRYEDVVKLLNSIDMYLTDSEIKKLEYAKKQLNQ